MELSLDTVREAALLLREKNLLEISIEATREGGPAQSFMLRRASRAEHAPANLREQGARAHGGQADDGPHRLQPPGAVGEPVVVVVEPLLVRATAVGLFRNPSRPIGAGDEVVSSQVVGIVESLKVPNEVRVPQAGRIVELLVEEGQGVEYGQPIVALRVGG